MANVHLSGEPRRLAGGASTIVVPGRTVRELIEELDARFPGIRDHLTDGVSVAIDGEVMSNADYVEIEEAAEVHFLPAIGGG